MPASKRGDLFNAPGIHIVTANSSISADGPLVMGMGASYAMRRRYPDAPRIFGDVIKAYCGHLGKYGLLLYGTMGVLQTRRHYQGPMAEDLIQYGLTILHAVAAGLPGTTCNVSHPGLRFDKTTMPDVEKMINALPDNVYVWQKE